MIIIMIIIIISSFWTIFKISDGGIVASNYAATGASLIADDAQQLLFEDTIPNVAGDNHDKEEVVVMNAEDVFVVSGDLSFIAKDKSSSYGSNVDQLLHHQHQIEESVLHLQNEEDKEGFDSANKENIIFDKEDDTGFVYSTKRKVEEEGVMQKKPSVSIEVIKL